MKIQSLNSIILIFGLLVNVFTFSNNNQIELYIDEDENIYAWGNLNDKYERNGIWTFFSSYPERDFVEFLRYNNGIKDGTWAFFENDSLPSLWHMLSFRNDSLNGKGYYFKRDGSIKQIIWYKNDANVWVSQYESDVRTEWHPGSHISGYLRNSHERDKNDNTMCVSTKTSFLFSFNCCLLAIMLAVNIISILIYNHNRSAKY